MALLHARLLQTGHRAVSAADGSSLITRDHACSWLSQPPQGQLVPSFKPQTELSSSFSSELFVYGIPEANVQINKLMPIRKGLPNGGRCQVGGARHTLNNLPFIPRAIRGTPQRKMSGSLTDRPGLESQSRSLPATRHYVESSQPPLSSYFLICEMGRLVPTEESTQGGIQSQCFHDIPKSTNT